MIKKIVVVGPESTGKTSLCQLLAEHFKSGWVPEYAREFLLANPGAYSFEDLYAIAGGQLEGEERISARYAGSKDTITPIFIDTDLQVIKVWSEFVFNKCDNRVLKGIAERHYDLYLLCDTDQPWVKDELREYPDLATRAKLYHYYKETMCSQQVPWVNISGNYEMRLETAIHAVNALLQ